MATYCIGDVQGCYPELQALLKLVAFDPQKDTLWFVGDLVNRGSSSLETLRFIKQLPNKVVVLGNHDLHLLALYCKFHCSKEAADSSASKIKLNVHNQLGGNSKQHKDKHPLSDVLLAKDAAELMHWLRKQPLLHHDNKLGYVMTHAGLYPGWSLRQAKKLAHEVEDILRGNNFCELFVHMYGNKPSLWQDNLRGWGRLRFIINAFARMRFCDAEGRLDLVRDGKVGTQQAEYFPWFELVASKVRGTNEGGEKGYKMLFGHWAALDGITNQPNAIALDTGCVWGRNLTAMRLEDMQKFSVQKLKF